MSGRKNPGTDYAKQLALENPTWQSGQLLEAVTLKYPSYTEAALRMMFHIHGISVPRRPRNYKLPDRILRVSSEKRKVEEKRVHPQPVIRASVHGYHGRSRLLPQYTEL